jgi:hypothetical protein
MERVWSKRSERGMTSMGIRFAEAATPTQCAGIMLPVSSQELERFDEREKGYHRVPLTLDMIQNLPYPTTDQEDAVDGDDEDVISRILQHASEAASSSRTSTRPCMWTYVPEHEYFPSPEYPIVQSYLDTILRGCLGISSELAQDFLLTTKGWQSEPGGEWIDDDLSDVSSDVSYFGAADDQSSAEDNGSTTGNVWWLEDRHDPIYPRGDPVWSRSQASVLDDLIQKHRPLQFAQRVKRRPPATMAEEARQ